MEDESVTTEFKVPSVKDYDPSAPDYAAKLDEGLRSGTEMLKNLSEEATALGSEGTSELVALLEAEGIEVVRHEQRSSDLMSALPAHIREQLEELNDMEGVDVSLKGIGSIMRISTVSKNKEEARKVEDITDAYRETYEAKAKNIQKREKLISRAIEDHASAIFGNTKTTPLLEEINPDSEDVHIFFLGSDGLTGVPIKFIHGARGYMFDWDKQYEVPVPDDFGPDNFEDGSFLANFQEEQSEIGDDVNSYLVVNPTSEIPAKKIINYAVKPILKEIAEKRIAQEKTDVQTPKGLASKLISGIKGGAAYLVGRGKRD